jgi:hypothetical protein
MKNATRLAGLIAYSSCPNSSRLAVEHPPDFAPEPYISQILNIAGKRELAFDGTISATEFSQAVSRASGGKLG